MLLIDRLKNKLQFSDSESKIADYVLQHPQKVTSMTIHELSTATYASAATITRFCRKVKTDGFTEFKIQLAKELSTYNLIDGRIEDNLPFSDQDTHQEIARNILNLNIQALMDTFNHLDIKQLVRIATMITQRKSIHLYGTGQSLVSCHDFHYKLFRIGYDSNFETHSGFQGFKSQSQPEHSIALMVSYYGIGINNLHIAQSLHARNIPLILITGPQENQLCPYATEVVHVPPQEKLIEKMASFSSRSAVQLVLDVIYSLIFSLDYDINKDRIFMKHHYDVK